MLQLDDLELCIEKINAAKSSEKAFEVYANILAECGYSRVTYSLVTDHPSLGLKKQLGLATSYPEDWIAYYFENGYGDIDPVVVGVLKSTKPFFWGDLHKDKNLSQQSLTILDQASEAGICSGIGFSMLGLWGEVVGIGLAREDKDDGKDYDFLAKAYLLSTYFHETYRSMLIKDKAPAVTVRESEVLHWAAEGKTDDEIANNLGISSNTVRFHWKNIFRKFNANGRMYAVTKAIRLGVIAPEVILPTYQSW
ncbi:MAG: DNA-binding CsgD family transcriptional regulator [Cryomorphaceae bacterium]|jgi:DNA-binding CsgD family transcriptional regulator